MVYIQKYSILFKFVSTLYICNAFNLPNLLCNIINIYLSKL